MISGHNRVRKRSAAERLGYQPMLPITLTTHNVGNVDSIGNAVFLAGQTRYACPHSTFMFHGVAFNFTQGMSLDERGSRERLANILSDQKRIGSIIQERTSL